MNLDKTVEFDLCRLSWENENVVHLDQNRFYICFYDSREINRMPPTQKDWDLSLRFLSNGHGNMFSSDLECGACDTNRCEVGTSLFILMDRGYCGRLTPVSSGGGNNVGKSDLPSWSAELKQA